MARKALQWFRGNRGSGGNRSFGGYNVRELALVVVVATAGVLIVAAVVFGPTARADEYRHQMPRVVKVLQSVPPSP